MAASAITTRRVVQRLVAAKPAEIPPRCSVANQEAPSPTVFNPSNTIYFVIFSSSLVLSALLVPTLKKIARRFSIVDSPNQSHKTHSEPIPYLGGFAIVIPTVLLTLVGPLLLEQGKDYAQRAALLILPSLILSFLGLLDDMRNLSTQLRFLVQISASIAVALLLIQAGFLVEITANLLANFLISILWMVGITNAFNFIDNLDGGAAGVTFVASTSIFLLGLFGDQYLIAAFGIVIAGASTGFLYWNRNPASIYLGDSGALFIGLVLSILLLQFEPSSSSVFASAILPVLVLAVPIIDTSVVVLSRWLRGVSIFQGGRDHLSHRLIGMGLSRKRVAVLLWLISGFFSALAILIESVRFEFDQAIANFGLSMMILLVFLFLWLPNYNSKEVLSP